MSDKLSRRDFLKLAMVGAAATALLGGDKLISHEQILEATTFVPDFFNVPKPSRENLLDSIPQTDDEIKNLVSDYYRQNFGNHGESVLDVMQKTADQIGDTNYTKPETISILPSVSVGEIEHDELRNITVTAEISEDYIDGQISRSDASLINISFEIGKFKIKTKFYTKEMSDEDIDKFNAMGFTGIKINGHITYTDNTGKQYSKTEYEALKESFSSGKTVELKEEDREIWHEDGYVDEYASSNLRSLTNIARNHPDKFFIAAGGNPSGNGIYPDIPDIREARKKLEDEGLWPKNLITTGFTHTFGTGETSPMTVGHDIYLTEENMNNAGIEAKTSFTTARIFVISKVLISKGANTASKLKASLFGMCETKVMNKPFDTNLDEIPVRVLN